MNKFNLTLLLIAGLLANHCLFVSCLDDDIDSSKLIIQNSNSTTKVEIKTDKASYNPGKTL